MSVSVTIESGDGWPVAGAVFTLTDLTGQQAGIAVADDHGVATLDGPPPGMYTAIFTAPGFSPSATAVVLSAGRATGLGTVRLDRIASETKLPEPGVWTIDPVHTMVNVSAKHAGISAVRGRFTTFGGTIVVGTPVESSTVRVTIQADSVDTASKMRDDHLRSPDFLDVERFPTVEYQGTGLTATGPDRWTLRGELTLRGEVRPMDLELRYLGTDTDPFGVVRCGFQASGQLRREDFQVPFATRLATGVLLVGSTVRIELDVEAVQGDKLPD